MKPQKLYHGSCQGISGNLTPRASTGDENGKFVDGPKNLVFATDQYKYAALYALKTNDMLSCGNCDGVSFSILRDVDKWKADLKKAACSVYELPSESFEPTISIKTGQPTPEWTSKTSVNPLRTIRETPESVMNHGNQLFFLDKAVEKEMWQYDQDGDPSATFINRLQAKSKTGALPADFTPLNLARECVDAGIMRHLNAEMDIKPIELPKSLYAPIIAEDIAWLKNKIQEHAIAQAVGHALINYRQDWSLQPQNAPNRVSGISRTGP